MKAKSDDVTGFKVGMKYEDGTISSLYVKGCNPTITALISNTCKQIE